MSSFLSSFSDSSEGYNTLTLNMFPNPQLVIYVHSSFMYRLRLPNLKCFLTPLLFVVMNHVILSQWKC